MKYSALSILSSLILLAGKTTALDFLLIGDFGWTPDMTDPNLNFDAINSYVGNLTKEGGKIDFIMTAGDNIYVKDELHPTIEEADLVMQLFLSRKNLKDLEIWPVRGNHDCYAIDPYYEVNLTKKYPTWKMPALYHEKTWDLGNGKSMGVLFVDTCLAICASYTYEAGTGGLTQEQPQTLEPRFSRRLEESLHNLKEVKRLKDVKCGDPVATSMGDKMFSWLNDTLSKWSTNSSILWKSTVQHHPIFGKWYQDYLNITQNYLPLMQQFGVDFYLNGHEHALEYAYYPYSQLYNAPRLTEDHEFNKHILTDYQCFQDLELFFGIQSRYSEFKKGDALHQMTVGSTGFDLYSICPARPSMGKYRYVNNRQHGFAHVQVNDRYYQVKFYGINQKTQEVNELYEIKVYSS